MGFFDFLKRVRIEEKNALNKEIKDEFEIEFEKIENFLNKKFESDIEKEKRTIEEIYFSLMKDIEKIKNLVKILEEKNFEKDDKIYAMINMTKNNYVKKVSTLFYESLEIEKFDYKEIKNFIDKMKKIIFEMESVNLKQAILLSKYFKDETQN
ncbi:MAG: hypothetical protein QW051_05030, partial [Candidatus Aenigmatarchaeota archaeon]